MYQNQQHATNTINSTMINVYRKVKLITNSSVQQNIYFSKFNKFQK